MFTLYGHYHGRGMNNQGDRMMQPEKVNQTLSADTMNTSANTVVS